MLRAKSLNPVFVTKEKHVHIHLLTKYLQCLFSKQGINVAEYIITCFTKSSGVFP